MQQRVLSTMGIGGGRRGSQRSCISPRSSTSVVDPTVQLTVPGEGSTGRRRLASSRGSVQASMSASGRDSVELTVVQDTLPVTTILAPMVRKPSAAATAAADNIGMALALSQCPSEEILSERSAQMPQRMLAAVGANEGDVQATCAPPRRMSAAIAARVAASREMPVSPTGPRTATVAGPRAGERVEDPKRSTSFHFGV